MRISKCFSGFCPTLNREYSIDVFYEEVASFGRPTEYVQVGADCEYASFNQCPNRKECPLRAKAPKETRSV